MQDKAEILKQLSANVSDFFTPLPIPIIDYPNDIKFLRDCVAGYQPCILRGYIDHWPALKLWNDEYLINKTEDLISINVTPHGHADSILVNEASGESVFVYPAEIPMHMREFLTELSSMDPSSAVLYLSQQDDNLRRQLPSLLDDIKGFHDLPEIAFGLSSPEAINLWIGSSSLLFPLSPFIPLILSFSLSISISLPPSLYPLYLSLTPFSLSPSLPFSFAFIHFFSHLLQEMRNQYQAAIKIILKTSTL